MDEKLPTVKKPTRLKRLYWRYRRPLSPWRWAPSEAVDAHIILFTLHTFGSIRTPPSGEPMSATREDLQRSHADKDVHACLQLLEQKNYVKPLGTGYEVRYQITPDGSAAMVEQTLLREGFDRRRGFLKGVFELLAAPVALILSTIALFRSC